MEVVSSVFCRISLVFKLADGAEPSPWETGSGALGSSTARMCVQRGAQACGVLPAGQGQGEIPHQQIPTYRALILCSRLPAHAYISHREEDYG